MPDTAVLSEMVKILGIGGLSLFILYVYHKTVSGQFDKIIDNQNAREKATFEQLNKIIDNQSEREKSNFSLLEQMISTNLLQNAHLEKIEMMIKNNNWCPFARKILGENNESGNNSN